MQDDAADDLNAVRTHTKHAVGCLANRGKGLRQDVVQCGAAGQTAFEFLRLGAQLLVGELAVRLLQRHDGADLRLELFDLALRARAEQFRKKSHNQTFLRRLTAQRILLHSNE